MKNFLLSILLLTSFTTFAGEIKLITEDSPPANYMKDGKLVGPAVEIVQEIQKKVGHTGKIEVLPWSRGYQMAQTENDIALFSTTRTDERETMFKWVGPLVTNKWVFLAKKGKGIKINSLDDAKKVKSIGTYIDDAKDQFLKSKGFTNVDTAPNDQANAKKLDIDRLDLWLTGSEDSAIIFKSEKIDASKFEPVFTAKEVKMFIAFSKNTPDDVIKKWQAAYDTLAKEGMIDKITNKYK